MAEGGFLRSPWHWQRIGWIRLGLSLIVIGVVGVGVGVKLAFDAAAADLGSMEKLFGPQAPGEAVIVMAGVGLVMFGSMIVLLPWPEMVPGIRRVWAKISRILGGTIARLSLAHRRRKVDPDDAASRIEAGDTSVAEDYVMAYFTVGALPLWLPIYLFTRRRK